jgi:hypothetical protein
MRHCLRVLHREHEFRAAARDRHDGLAAPADFGRAGRAGDADVRADHDASVGGGRKRDGAGIVADQPVG